MCECVRVCECARVRVCACVYIECGGGGDFLIYSLAHQLRFNLHSNTSRTTLSQNLGLN